MPHLDFENNSSTSATTDRWEQSPLSTSLDPSLRQSVLRAGQIAYLKSGCAVARYLAEHCAIKNRRDDRSNEQVRKKINNATIRLIVALRLSGTFNG